MPTHTTPSQAAGNQLARRKFLAGEWCAAPDSTDRHGNAPRANILVQVAPDQTAAVELAIRGVDGLRLIDRKSVGRLTVAVADADAIGPALSALMSLRGVLTAVVDDGRLIEGEKG